MIAGVAGLVAVIAVMLVYYKRSGVNAVLALALNHELPVSFAGTGPGVPGDLAECSTALLSGRSGHQLQRGRSAVYAA